MIRRILANWGFLLLLGARVCSATTAYSAYTGESITGGQDNNFSIIANDIFSNGDGTGTIEGGTGSPAFGAFIVTNTVRTDNGWAAVAQTGGSWDAPQVNQTMSVSNGAHPITSTGTGCCTGTTTYQVTFNLAAYLLSTVTLETILAADDSVTVTLNGHTLSGYSGVGYTSLSTINPTITGDLISGINDLDFIVNNSGGGPTGLDDYVLVSGTSSVPEPATLGLVGLSLVGLAGLRLRPLRNFN